MIVGIVMFLLPKIKSGLAFSILQTVTRGKGAKCDSCGTSIEIQWCDSCNRFMCLTCEDEVHTKSSASLDVVSL
jgi:hypothetical protein